MLNGIFVMGKSTKALLHVKHFYFDLNTVFVESGAVADSK